MFRLLLGVSKKREVKEMKIILDGNNTAFRANATNNLTMKNGERVAATYGTLNIILSFLKKNGSGWVNKLLTAAQDQLRDRTAIIDEVIVCWDGGKSKFRKAIYSDYKGHREVKRKEYTDDEQKAYHHLLNEMENLHEILPHFGVKSLKFKGWEADDLIYLSNKLKADGEISIIVSTDRDMLQLVDDTTFVWSPVKEQLITPETFLEFTGVPKRHYLTYRVLVGDKSDNIDGIHGIGDAKARALIMKYGDLSGIQANSQELMKSKVNARIVENPALLERNMKLMDMNLIPFGDIQEVAENILKTPVKFESSIVRVFFMSKQFVSFIKDFSQWELSFKNLH